MENKINKKREINKQTKRKQTKTQTNKTTNKKTEDRIVTQRLVWLVSAFTITWILRLSVRFLRQIRSVYKPKNTG